MVQNIFYISLCGSEARQGLIQLHGFVLFSLYKIHRCSFRGFILIIIELLSVKAEGTGMCYFDLHVEQNLLLAHLNSNTKSTLLKLSFLSIDGELNIKC